MRIVVFRDDHAIWLHRAVDFRYISQRGFSLPRSPRHVPGLQACKPFLASYHGGLQQYFIGRCELLVEFERPFQAFGENRRVHEKTPQIYFDWFERRGDRWVYELNAEDDTEHKRPGKQGPIDDAFTSPFVCVRGTGTPWNPAVHAYAEASLQRFAREWRQYFRGDLPIINDTDLSADDARNKNLILFGDPGSNLWIAKFQSHFPIEWTKETVRFGQDQYPATCHVPAFIMPKPRDGLGHPYVVVNSGHTFRGDDLGKLNYLLYPRWGDWAVLKIDPNNPTPEPLTEEVLRAGYFDEEWRLPK